MKYHLKGKYRLKVNAFLVKQFKVWCSLFLIIGSSSYILKNAYAQETTTTHWDISDASNPGAVSADYADGTLTISGNGTMKVILPNAVLNDIPWYGYKDNITKVIIEGNITATNLHGMFRDLTNLKTIKNLDKINTSHVTNMSTMFYNCNSLTKLDVSNFDTSKVKDMSSMFFNCKALTELDVSNFDTSKVKDMSSMFYNCQSLNELDVSNFKTSNVTNMSSMFSNCQSLTELDVSNFNTGKVTSMFYMFCNCEALTELNVSNFDTSQVTDMACMFYNCQVIKKLDISNFDTSQVTNAFFMFSSCQSLVNVQGLDITKDNCDVDFIFSNTPHLSQVHVKTKKQLEIPYTDSNHRWYDEDDKILNDNDSGTAAIIPISDDYVTYTLSPAITHDIMYELDGGTLESKQDKFEILKGYELPMPTKSEYIFDGWYDSADFDKKISKIEKYTLEDKTVYAKWTKKAELQANNFSVKLSSDTYTGDEITYTITSSLEGVGIPQVKKLEKDGIEVNKVREAGTYKITFDVDEGEKYLGATGLTIVFTIENKPVVEPEDPTRPNDKPIPPVNKPTIPIENSTPSTNNSKETTNVETGDNSFIILYGGMMLVGLGIMIYLRRKENE